MKEPSTLQLNHQLCFALYSTSLAIVNAYKPRLAQLNLTYPQYLVMLILWEKDDLALKDVCAQLGQKPGAITPVVKRLEAIGYVVRRSNLKDERSILIQLTEEGRLLRAEALDVKAGIYHDLPLSVDDQTALAGMLNVIREAFSS